MSRGRGAEQTLYKKGQGVGGHKMQIQQSRRSRSFARRRRRATRKLYAWSVEAAALAALPREPSRPSARFLPELSAPPPLIVFSMYTWPK